MTFDVVVVGGGPGGSVCAAKLAERGRRVLVLEREKFPRFHLGESLLPGSMPVLESLGVMPEMRERFIVKYGARFHFDAMSAKERYVFSNAFDCKYDHAFQVPRDEFDDVLLRNAERRGAEVRHEWEAKRIRFEGTRASGVVAVDPGGAVHEIEAGFVVDATGRDALLAGDRREKSKIDRLDKSAFYNHYRSTRRQPGALEGDIDIVIFGEDPSSASGWFWFIPFKDGRTSVGAVVSSAWVKQNRDAGDASGLLSRAIDQSPAAQSLLEGAEPLWPKARAAADYSYRVESNYGDGFVMVGDSGGFVDPLFSSGAHIAMRGADTVAEHIDAALAAGDVSAARFAEWSAEVKLGTETFVDAVQAFYAGGLVRYLFAEKQHTFLRRSITSLLAGEVYSREARWIRDVRVRLAEMAKPAWRPEGILGV
jgi:flavin-dependent dehydrogenase